MKTLVTIAAFLALAMTAPADEIALRTLATGLPHPVAITNCGDGRLFVTLKGGRIVIIAGVAVLPSFLDITPLVSTGDEQGLLSVAFDPLYQTNGFFYVDYTDVNGNTVIARYSVSKSDPDRADPTSATTLLTIAQPYPNHNGGQLQFGPDGYLYVGMGDGGSAGDPQNRAQSLTTLLGKLLRIDVRNSSPYAIPTSNPFIGRPDALPEIWAYGLRNPWRFSFDRNTGDLLIADVGQDSWEEVDFQPRSSLGGVNYGWRRMEGTHCYSPSVTCQDASLTLPVIEYSHAFGCSITGGYVYRGSRWPRLNGTYFYGDYCSGTIWGARQMADGSWTSRTLASTGFAITTFGEGFDGELYVADFNAGKIYGIGDALPQPPRRRATRP